MSTKATIAYGANFHLYHEGFDEDHVYLELEGTQFEAAYNRVMVPIPVHVWEVIRQYPGVDLKYADKTDAELRQYVEQEVDDRLKPIRIETTSEVVSIRCSRSPAGLARTLLFKRVLLREE